MKNKFTITMVCIISAFFIGKNVGAAGSMDKNHIDPAEIVDWNTDGKELSISTADGYEYYAYRKKRVMRRSIRNARSAYWLRKWQYRVIKSSLTTLLKGALRGSFFLEMVSGITY